MSEFINIQGVRIRKSKIDYWEIQTNYSEHYYPCKITIILDGQKHHIRDIGKEQAEEYKKQLEEL